LVMLEKLVTTDELPEGAGMLEVDELGLLGVMDGQLFVGVGAASDASRRWSCLFASLSCFTATPIPAARPITAADRKAMTDRRRTRETPLTTGVSFISWTVDSGYLVYAGATLPGSSYIIGGGWDIYIGVSVDV